MDSNQQVNSAPPGFGINTFFRLRDRRSRLLNSLRFLVRCKKRRIIPKFIHLKCPLKPTYRIKKTLTRCKLQLLRTTILDTRGQLAKVEASLYHHHLLHAKRLHSIYWNSVDNTSFHRTSRKSDKHAKQLTHKFNNLKKKTDKPISEELTNIVEKFPPAVVNLSGSPVSDDTIQVLNLGLNFSVKPKTTKPEDFIAPVEKSFKQSKLSAGQLDFFRHQIKNILTENAYNSKSNLKPNEIIALKSLKNNSDLTVVPADKGGQTVILTKTQYKNGMENILNDDSYKKIVAKRDPVLTTFNKVQKLVKTSTFIPASDKFKVTPNNYHAGRIYALPKVHKINSVFRPIVSNIGTPTYQLSKYLVKTLSPLTKLNTRTVLNSKIFTDKLHTIQPNNSTMISLDITSMFTNIPIAGALATLKSRLTESGMNTLQTNEIINLTEICVNSAYFTYDNQLYQQTKGLSMGNPLSPILCDIFMDYFETKALNHPIFKINHWFRYVDDTFTLWPYDRDKIPEFLNWLNGIDPNIQFTIEYETNNSISFLDVLVQKDTIQNKFLTSVYRKPFSVSLPPHSRSNHSYSHKISAFYTYVKRALEISSNDTLLQKELTTIKAIALYRGYDPIIIDQAMNKFNKFRPDTTLNPIESTQNKERIIIPFQPEISLQIASGLKNDFKIIFLPINKTSQILTSNKDEIPMHLKWGIYSVPCDSCNLSYIGQTKRSIKIRMKEHSALVKNYRIKSNKDLALVTIEDVNNSSLAQHSIQNNHNFKFDEAKIIKSTKYISELNYFESIEIIKNKPLIVNDYMPNISDIWKDLFH